MAFDSTLWVNTLARQTGAVLPPDILNNLIQKTSIADVNREFFAWYETQQQAVADSDVLAPVKGLLNVKFDVTNTEQYKTAQRNFEASLRSATDYARESQSNLRRAAQHREQIEIMLKREPVNLEPQVLQVINSGWYKFEVEATERFSNEEKNTVLIFSTPDVVLDFKNPSANVNMSVPMGRYQVRVKPAINTIEVKNHYGTREVAGHIHPHVASDASICWGNAFDMYIKAMNDFNFVDPLTALQVILTTYNEASPYVGLHRWDELRNPDKYPCEYRYYDTNSYPYDDIAFLDENLNWYAVDPNEVTIYNSDEDSILPNEQGEFDEDPSTVYIRIFRQYRNGNRVPNTPHFVKMRDGTFRDFNSLLERI